MNLPVCYFRGRGGESRGGGGGGGGWLGGEMEVDQPKASESGQTACSSGDYFNHAKCRQFSLNYFFS